MNDRNKANEERETQVSNESVQALSHAFGF
jgi:hypothetical protein